MWRDHKGVFNNQWYEWQFWLLKSNIELMQNKIQKDVYVFLVSSFAWQADILFNTNIKDITHSNMSFHIAAVMKWLTQVAMTPWQHC